MLNPKVTIKSGSGDNYFEAVAELGSGVFSDQTETVMENLRQMQKDRMEWAEKQTKR